MIYTHYNFLKTEYEQAITLQSHSRKLTNDLQDQIHRAISRMTPMTPLNHSEYLILNDVLPQEVLWRKKEAFSDGVSKKSRSLYEIIQEYVSNMGNLPIYYAIHYEHNDPDTKEKQYYRYIYEQYYPNTEKLVPYFWMPKWVNATDASARTLDIYDEE
jgi:asparagine synthase (glutamine-hydrolysing)